MWQSAQITVFDLVMRAPIQLQWIFSYTILANPKVEPHAPNTCQSKQVPVYGQVVREPHLSDD